MSVISETGLYGRVMAGIAATGIVAGALAFVPSPLSVFDLFEQVTVPEVKKLPPLKVQAMPALEAFAVLTERPLFNPERLPGAEPAQGDANAGRPGVPALGDLSQYRLVGLAGDSDTQLGLIRKNGGPLITVKPGDSLEGWTVGRIGPHGVSISGGGRKEVLTIPKATNSARSP